MTSPTQPGKPGTEKITMRNPYTDLGALKIYACLAALLTGWEGLSLHQGSAPDFFAFSFLLGVAALGLMDAVINDLLPAEYALHFTEKYRHFIFILLAGGQLSVLHAAVITHYVGFGGIRYALDASVAVLVAVLDLSLRRQNAKKQPADDSLPAGAA